VGAAVVALIRLCRNAGLCAAIACVAVGSAAAQTPPPGTRYDQVVTQANRVATTVTNYGFFGNNFFSRSASLEFPAGSGYEHLPDGGLWVGGQAHDAGGSFIGVTTSVIDAAQGVTSPGRTEFSPASLGIVRRSQLPASPYYGPDAVSDEDAIAVYDDLTPRSIGTESHRSLGIHVRQESYAWAWPSLRDILFVHFVIRNGGAALTNVWVGLYTEFASGNKAAYRFWPPIASDPSGLGFWYRRKWLGYEDSMRLVREHYCAGPPFPAGCQAQLVPPWIGLELLTPPAAGQHVTLAAWNFMPNAADRDQDVERYAIMSSGNIQSFDVDSLRPNGIATGSPDPVELLAIGPFANLATGDSIGVDFAFVGGDDAAAIHVNGIMAREVFDAGYGGAVTPVQLSLAGASATAENVALRWFVADAAGRELRVERREIARDWMPVGMVQAQSSGVIEFEDHSVIAGTRYGYRLAWSEGGRDRSGGEAWVDVPAAAVFRLDGARPNPAAGHALQASFSLSRRGEVRLRLLDLSGRRVHEQRLGILEPGEHLVPLGIANRLAPGVYWLELSQGGSLATARVAVIR